MRFVLWCLVFLSGYAAATEQPPTLHLYTEHLPPYSYIVDGRPDGINVELMRQLCQRLELDCNITVLPWRRAYENAQHQQMSGVFSTARSAAREPLFRWVGPIASDWGYLFRLKGRTEVNPTNLEEAKNFKLAVARGDVYESYFKRHGFEFGRNMLDFATKSEPVPLFMAKRVDLLVGSKRSLRNWLRNNKLPEDSAEALFKLEDVGDNYLALNLLFPVKLAERMQLELEQMRQEGTINVLIQRYTDASNP